MRSQSRLCLFALAGLMSLLPLARPSAAGLVPAGGTTTAAARPELAGTVVRDETIPFTVDGPGGTIFTGALRDQVLRATDGTLSFAQLVEADSSLARRALLDF